jgi:hypothetical protein
VLGLAPSATEQAIKEAYRDLVKVWHPDRFGSDPRLRAKAQEKLKEVNAAFEQLRGYRPPDPRPSREAAAPVEVRRPAVVHRAKYGLTGVVLLLLLLAAVAGAVGARLFISGRRITQPPPAPEAFQTAVPTSPTRAPATPHSVRRGVAEARPDGASTAPESAAVPTTGSLRVASRPMGARVLLDGRVVGETPMVVTNVAPGEHQIGLDLDAKGYQRWSSSVVVPAGHEETLLAVMTAKERPR